MKRTWMILALLSVTAWARGAEAQISRGTWRLSADVDMFGVAGVERDPPGYGEADYMVVSLGPNQLGGGRVSGLPTPLGVGLAYAFSHRLLFGMRTALGYDVVSPDGGDNVRNLALGLQPGLTFIPLGQRNKLYLHGAPIFQIDRAKTDDGRNRTLLGGFGLGVGGLFFVRNDLSIDLGFHFEGRFGNNDGTGQQDVHYRDLRGVVRVGISYWK